ncbi:MAG TPA: sphingomyelin phosphodiesterase [Oligoflexus sp.]|uniref:sphingomyelin phosphodiesterase n=1 Tax=Oligoflexus sp. TaxID=1971216 RepID=UPI002D5129A9|nr:sphingomyelin phosphodiesterase [Oligoflexus sp.]HYX32420.1 sphingomyelin phosphodiesterase [Oligoflexus sp.]
MSKLSHLGVWGLACTLFLSSLQAAPQNPRYEDNFRLITFNVFFLPRIISHWGQQSRAELIAQADFMKGQDLVILNELFDDPSSATLLRGLQPEYPYQTPILSSGRGSWDATLGSSHPLKPGNGGVAILSRWPIVKKIQYIYADSCGTDGFSKKGFVYVKVDRQGQPYHVIGTHAQSEAEDCLTVTAGAIRAKQFDEIRRFLDQQSIPPEEVVFIGGDLNVIKDTGEYQDVLQRLGVLEPDSYAGHHTSWDPIGNALAYGQYPDWNHSEYLDYIFVSARHARPSFWHNQTLDAPSPRWAEGNYYYQEYSDHYPVKAFAHADPSTPTHSLRPENRPYDTVHLRHETSGRYVTASTSKPNDWLTVVADQPGTSTAFRLDNWYPAKHPFCVRSGDFVQLQSCLHPGFYWNWYLGFSGNYGYYLKDQDSSNLLRLQILDDQGECLQNGDRIYFVDKDTVKGKDAHIRVPTDGSWQNHMFLQSSNIGGQEIFKVEIPEEPIYTDWSNRLRYQD